MVPNVGEAGMVKELRRRRCRGEGEERREGFESGFERDVDDLVGVGSGSSRRRRR